MKNLKKDIKERRKVFEDLFKKIDRNDWMDYYQNQNSFASLYNDSENPQALANYLNDFSKQLVNEVLSTLTGIRENEEAQKEFLIWFCGRISYAFKQWCSKLETSGERKVQGKIESIIDFQRWLKYHLELKEENINVEEEKKKNVMFNDPLTVSNDLSMLVTYSRIYKDEFEEDEFLKKWLEISEEILKMYKNIELPYFESYQNIEYHKQANIIHQKVHNTFQRFKVILDDFFLETVDPNEIILMKSFWNVIESIYENTEKEEINPDEFLVNYFYNKIQYNPDGINSGMSEFDFEEDNSKVNAPSISQKLLLSKLLGLDEIFAEQELHENKQKSIMLGFLFGELPSSVEKRLTGFESRIRRSSPQNIEDIRILEKTFKNAGLGEFFEKRRNDLGLLILKEEKI